MIVMMNGERVFNTLYRDCDFNLTLDENLKSLPLMVFLNESEYRCYHDAVLEDVAGGLGISIDFLKFDVNDFLFEGLRFKLVFFGSGNHRRDSFHCMVYVDTENEYANFESIFVLHSIRYVFNPFLSRISRRYSK